MDANSSTFVGKAIGPGRILAAIVRSDEVSERPDSRGLAFLEDGAREAQPERRTPALEMRRPRRVDQKLVDQAATWISAKVAATLRKGAEEVGNYVLETFFDGDVALAKARTPRKSASFRALAEKCGTPELPISKTWLNNAVGIAVITRCLPEDAPAFRALPASYQERLLPLRDPEKIEKLAKQAKTRDLSCRELRDAVARHLAKDNPIAKGHSHARVVFRTLARSAEILGSEEHDASFSAAAIEKMDPEDREQALRSAETLIKKLRELAKRLKRG